MKKNLLLYILLGFLIVMNGFFLFKHFGTYDKEGFKRPGPTNFIVKQLEFDATQLERFEELDRAHHEKINAILVEIRASKYALFDKLFEERIDNSEINAITSQIADLEKAKEWETFTFFKSVSEICDENQKTRFTRIIKDGIERQGPPPDRNGPSGRSDGEHGPPPPRK